MKKNVRVFRRFAFFVSLASFVFSVSLASGSGIAGFGAQQEGVENVPFEVHSTYDPRIDGLPRPMATKLTYALSTIS
jgi:hypothetical protein